MEQQQPGHGAAQPHLRVQCIQCWHDSHSRAAGYGQSVRRCRFRSEVPATKGCSLIARGRRRRKDSQARCRQAARGQRRQLAGTVSSHWAPKPTLGRPGSRIEGQLPGAVANSHSRPLPVIRDWRQTGSPFCDVRPPRSNASPYLPVHHVCITVWA